MPSAAALASASSSNGRTTRVNLGTRDELSRRRTDDDHGRDEPLVAEDEPVLERTLRHLADGQAIDVDVAAVHLPGHRCLAADQVDDHTVLGNHDALVRHA